MPNFGLLYHVRSPNMVISSHPNFKSFYFGLILHLILGQVRKFLVEKFSASGVISKKPHGMGEWGTSPPPSAVRVNSVYVSQWSEEGREGGRAYTCQGD